MKVVFSTLVVPLKSTQSFSPGIVVCCTVSQPNKAAINAKTQQFDTVGSVKPTDFDGVLSEGKPLCATNLTDGIADLELTIWLEGWDHNVIDEENTHSFNLDLQFQISRL